MNDFLIKGTLMGLTKEQVFSDFKIFVSSLHTVMENWASHNFFQTGEIKGEYPLHVKKSYGEVRQAIIAMETDIHFLSVCYHQFQHTELDDNLDNGIKSLYFTNLTESYFTNLRSIYDRLATFPRIVLSDDELKSDGLNKDSFNSLVKSCRFSAAAKAAYSTEILDMIFAIDVDLQNVRLIRDAIIHHGKEPIVINDKGRGLTLKIPSSIGNYSSANILPNILNLDNDEYPLYDYLREITLRLLINMEEMGNLLGHYYFNSLGEESQIYYYGLAGQCMETYLKFLFPKGIKTHITLKNIS